MGKAPKAPEPTKPEVSAAADQRAQTGTAIAQTWMNNPQRYTPYGTQEFKRTGSQYTVDAQGKTIEVPTFSEYVRLSPAEQAKYDLENQMDMKTGNIALRQLDQVSDRLDDPFTVDGLPETGQLKGDYDTYRQDALQTLRRYYQPELDRQQQANYTDLANRGIREGSEAYREAMAMQQRGRNDAELSMIMQAGGEADRALGADINRLQTAETQRERRLQEQLLERQLPMQELLAAASNNQISINSPQFAQFAPGTIRPTDVAGQYNHYDNMRMQQYQAQMQSYNARMAGMAQLGGAAMGLFRLSDVRLKSDIIKLADDVRGFGWYEYTIGGRREVGVIAQEVAPIVPNAVREFGGVLMVNYGALIDGR